MASFLWSFINFPHLRQVNPGYKLKENETQRNARIAHYLQRLESLHFFQTVDEFTNPTERVWAPVKCPKPEEGLLIVNLGKNMDFWSGGRFKATLHRVVNKTRERRYSVPFFFEPNMDAMIRPILNTKDKVKEAQMKAYIQDTFGKEYIMPADLFFERLNQRNNKNFDP